MDRLCQNIVVNHHRNGVSGIPFYVCTFTHEGQPMMGVVFDVEEFGHCAVFNTDKIGKGDVAFMSNSWRGDQFEPELRRAIVKRNKR